MNITEFSKIAGVSKSAVSRYFNQGYLALDKRKLIEDAIEKTGYHPSVSAQSVKTRVTKLVGVILPKLSSESCARVTEGISEILYENGYQILLVNTANDYNKEIEYLDLFRHNRVDGVILLATTFTSMHKNLLNKMKIPVVIVGQEYKGFSCVCHDDFTASYNLTKLMLEKGCTKPAYIGVSNSDKAVGENRQKGFLKALEESHLKLEKNHTAIAEFTIDSGYKCAKRIFSSKNKPDCVFCATDNIAAGVVSYCNENSIKIPQDVIICGVGDAKIGTVTATPLTTARLHYKTAGMEAAQLLLKSIGKENVVPKTVKLDYEIIERKSTAK